MGDSSVDISIRSLSVFKQFEEKSRIWRHPLRIRTEAIFDQAHLRKGHQPNSGKPVRWHQAGQSIVAQRLD
jgi:hypothetical protein